MFNRNFWNLEQEQLSGMLPSDGVIYKANPRPAAAGAELHPGSTGRARLLRQGTRPLIPPPPRAGLSRLVLAVRDIFK